MGAELHLLPPRHRGVGTSPAPPAAAAPWPPRSPLLRPPSCSDDRRTQLKRLFPIGSFPRQPARLDLTHLVGLCDGGDVGRLGHGGRAGAPLGLTPRLLLLPLLGGLAARSLLLGPLPVLLLLLLGDVLEASLDAPGAAAG